MNSREQKQLLAVGTAAYRRNPKLTIAAVVILCLVLAFFYFKGQDSGSGSGSITPDVSVDPAKMSATLDSLEVRSSDPTKDYDREAFGASWSDSAGDFAWTGNSCDTRNDVLQRDLVDEVTEGSCEVNKGVLSVEPYSGQKEYVFDKSKGSSGANALDIDHVVALGNAWISGAYQMTPEDRAAIANDPLNLLAVSASENRKKSDRDASEYLPPNGSYACKYVALQLEVKKKYGLTVSENEKKAMENVIGQC